MMKKLFVIFTLIIFSVTAHAEIIMGSQSTFTANVQQNDIVRGIPKKYWYINPTITALSQWMVEIFVSPHGSDVIDGPDKGFTPYTPFKTVQGCLNYLQTFILKGVWPVCRLMKPDATQAVYQRRIEMTGGPFGQQMDGGGQPLIQGTCPISGSPWNGYVGYSAGIDDVKLLSEVGLSLVSTINSGYLMFQCLQAGADQYVFSSTQYGHNFIPGAVKVVNGPSGPPSSVILAQQGGQALIANITVATNATNFATGYYGSVISFSGGAGSVIFSGSPAIGTVMVLSFNSTAVMGNGNIFTGTISGTGSACAISFNSSMNTNATSASIPHGSGSACAAGVSTGGQLF